MNLNEVSSYEDAVDQWAAECEFELRREAYMRYCEGMLGAVRKATNAMQAMRVAIGGAYADRPR